MVDGGLESRCRCREVGVMLAVMVGASGIRISWAQLPQRVRVAVEEILGASVVEAVSQPGGFSPGSADRVRTGEGVRAFVKAAGLDPNPDPPQLHRREARITAALPVTVPAPRLLGHYDDGDWVALVLQDVDGWHPVTPWHAEQDDRPALRRGTISARFNLHVGTVRSAPARPAPTRPDAADTPGRLQPSHQH